MQNIINIHLVIHCDIYASVDNIYEYEVYLDGTAINNQNWQTLPRDVKHALIIVSLEALKGMSMYKALERLPLMTKEYIRVYMFSNIKIDEYSVFRDLRYAINTTESHVSFHVGLITSMHRETQSTIYNTGNVISCVNYSFDFNTETITKGERELRAKTLNVTWAITDMPFMEIEKDDKKLTYGKVYGTYRY